MKIDRSEFLKILKTDFPELRQELNQQQGLLHLEVAEFRKYANQLIRSDDKIQVERCFKIAHTSYLFMFLSQNS
jgi:hypothetical protein